MADQFVKLADNRGSIYLEPMRDDNSLVGLTINNANDPNLSCGLNINQVELKELINKLQTFVVNDEQSD